MFVSEDDLQRTTVQPANVRIACVRANARYNVGPLHDRGLTAPATGRPTT